MKYEQKRWEHLMEQQHPILQWVLEGSGSAELMARAGCGKTYTLLQVVEAIIEGRLGDVALMAYNKKIADEIKAKLIAAGYDWKKAQAGTVHSFGLAAWKKIAPNLVVDEDKLSKIIKQEAFRHDNMVYVHCAMAIEKLCTFAKQRAFGHLEAIEDFNAWMKIWEHFNLDDDITEDDRAYDVIYAAQNVYKISLRACRDVIDFDDMILAPLYFKARFWPKDWILLDESQDTNPARRALALAMLKPRTGRMIFVGDPAQGIYGFTGADNDAMKQLKEATNAITLPLTVTRRCPKLVVAEAQKFVPDFTAWEGAEEGVVRTAEYDKLAEENLGKDDVILCRNTAPLIRTAYMIISKGIACHVEGREIGKGLIKLARRWKLTTIPQLAAKLEDYKARQTANFKSKGQDDKIERLIDQLDCLDIIINRCRAQKKNLIDDVVADIESIFGNTKEGEMPKVLTLSTIHKAKGREWHRVYILGREKYMPSPYAKKEWQQEQERNLEYVGITRALKELIDVPAPSDSDKPVGKNGEQKS